MHTRKHTHRLAILAALALVATACGGGSEPAPEAAATTAAPDTTAAPTTTAAAPTTTEATTTSTAAPATTAAPTTTEATTTTSTTTTTMPPNLLVSAGVDDPGPAIPAGEYHTRALSHTLYHVLNEQVSVWHPDGVTYIIGAPGFNVGTDASMVFMDASAVPTVETVDIHEAGGDAPQRRIFTAQDLDAFFTDTPGVLILDSGTHDDGHSLNHWWEFTVDPATADGFDHCHFGDHCINILWIDACDCYFIAGEEWTFRVWRLGHGDGAVYAWFQAPNEIYADTIDFGVSLAEGTTVGH